MEQFGAFITATVNLIKLPITVFGFTFSFWQVWLFSAVAGTLAWGIGRIFGGE